MMMLLPALRADYPGRPRDRAAHPLISLRRRSSLAGMATSAGGRSGQPVFQDGRLPGAYMGAGHDDTGPLGRDP